LSHFQTGDSIRRLPCFHFFHTTEIDTWLRQNHVCPICRLPVDQPQPQSQPQPPSQPQLPSQPQSQAHREHRHRNQYSHQHRHQRQQ
jgi:hypothetical protein